MRSGISTKMRLILTGCKMVTPGTLDRDRAMYSAVALARAAALSHASSCK